MIIRHTTPLLVSLIVTVSSFSLQRNSPWRYAVPPLKRQGTRQHIHQATPTLKRLRVAAKTDNDDDQGTKPKRRFSLFFFKPRKSRFEKFVDKLFESADTNNDGSVSLGETYEMVLQMYVKLNRQAPIPPPSRQKLYKLFRASDVDRNDRISREEFTSLAKTLGRRAMTRLVAHKAVTLIGAPLWLPRLYRLSNSSPIYENDCKRMLPLSFPTHWRQNSCRPRLLGRRSSLSLWPR